MRQTILAPEIRQSPVESTGWLMRFPSLRRWDLDGEQTAKLVGVLLLTLTVSLRSLGNGFVFDDYKEFLHNNLIGEWSFVWKSLFHDVWWFLNPKVLPQSWYYRPLQNVWFALGFHIFGFDPVGWHAAKIVLHLLVVLLSFRAAQLLTRDVTAATLCALFFGLLPPNAEPVAWVSAIPQPIAAAFELSAFCMAIDPGRTRRASIASVACFAMALGSFEGAITFPFLIFGYFVLLGEPNLKSSALTLERIIEAARQSIPYLVVCAIYLGLRFYVLRSFTLHFPIPKSAGSRAHSLLQLIATLPAVFAHYLAMLIVPWLAGPAHRVTWVEGFAASQFYVPVAVLLALTIVAYLAVRHDHRRNLYLFCGLWFVIAIAPAMNLAGVWDLVQDRYLYLPAFGFCVIAADCFARLARLTDSPRWYVVPAAIAAVYACGFWQVEGYWKNQLTMYARRAEVFPELPRWHQALYGEYEKRNDLIGYQRELEVLVRLEPRNPKYHFLLSELEGRLGNTAKARQEYLKSVQSRLYNQANNDDTGHDPSDY